MRPSHASLKTRLSSWASRSTAFEKAFAEYVGARFCVGVNSGTAALQLALMACGIGRGDEVIVPSFTFFATAEAVSVLGARPVFVDVDPVSYTITAAAIEKAITPRTRAIIPVHLYGQAADLDPILALADTSQPACHRRRGAGARRGIQRQARWRARRPPVASVFIRARTSALMAKPARSSLTMKIWRARLRLLRDHGQTSNTRMRSSATTFAGRDSGGGART